MKETNMEKLKWRALEEKLMRNCGKEISVFVKDNSEYKKELGFGKENNLDELDYFFNGRKRMFSKWFKRDFNKWFYRND